MATLKELADRAQCVEIYDGSDTRFPLLAGRGTYTRYLRDYIGPDWEGWAKSIKELAHTTNSSYKGFSGAKWHGNR